MTAKKIDCHTHIVNENIKREYFLNTDGFALVMPFIDKFKANSPPDDSYETVKNDSRLFLCPSIDISGDIPQQLADIEEKLSSYRIVGLKIYLTYQAGRADDECLMCVYEFAKKKATSELISSKQEKEIEKLLLCLLT